MDGSSHPVKAQTTSGKYEMIDARDEFPAVESTARSAGHNILEHEEESGLPGDVFISWRRDTLSTVCEKLSSAQRSAFLFELLGKLPANNRLYLVRNIDKIATIDFISDLPVELALSILTLLDPASLLDAAQVSKYWCKLINSECKLWRGGCLSYRLRLQYNLPHHASYYKDHILTYLTYLTKLQNKAGCRTASVSEATSQLAHMNRTMGLAANSARIYSGGDDRHLRSWDRNTHQMLSDREGMSTSCLDCTERLVAAGLYNGCILIFNGDLSHVITTCSRHMGPVYDVKWTADSATVVSGSSDCTVRVWDISENSNTCRHVFRGHDTMVNKILLLGEPTPRIFSLDIATINVWSVEAKKKVCALRPLSCSGKEGYFQPGLIHAHSVKRDGAQCGVVVCGSNNGIYVWDADSYQLLNLIKSPGYVCAEHVIGAGSAFIAATYDEGVAIINTATGHHEATIAVHQFNNTNCGIWLDRESAWLHGVFRERSDERAIFVVTTFAGDITSFYLDKNMGSSNELEAGLLENINLGT